MCGVVSSKLGDVQAVFYVVATLTFTEEDFAIVGNYGLTRKITYGMVSMGDYVVEKNAGLAPWMCSPLSSCLGSSSKSSYGCYS